MNNTTETESDVLDCMAVWEAFLADPIAMDSLPDEGMARRREIVATVVTPLCDDYFNYAQSLGFYHSYDWEFVPRFIKRLAEQNPDVDDTLALRTIVEELIDETY